MICNNKIAFKGKEYECGTTVREGQLLCSLCSQVMRESGFEVKKAKRWNQPK